MDATALRAEVASVPLWYHTIDVGEGVSTPGWFDLRPIVDAMPWPDVKGKRCLDVGTYDGFLAFELERRGASEVVALDVSDHAGWDWPVALAEQGPKVLAEIAGPEKRAGFETARRLLGSDVVRLEGSVYDLSPDEHGTFDVVVCGSLMLHLKNPIGALEAIRSVCGGEFLSAEQIELDLTLMHRRRPIARVADKPERLFWWQPNVAGHLQMLGAAGFEVLESTGAYVIPLGASHPQLGKGLPLKERAARALSRVGTGVPHAAARTRPAHITSR
jgi:tRNA (mo5U34)-methyltransferase